MLSQVNYQDYQKDVAKRVQYLLPTAWKGHGIDLRTSHVKDKTIFLEANRLRSRTFKILHVCYI